MFLSAISASAQPYRTSNGDNSNCRGQLVHHASGDGRPSSTPTRSSTKTSSGGCPTLRSLRSRSWRSRTPRFQPLASDGSEQGELFATYRHHAFITNSTLGMVEADQRHRDHAPPAGQKSTGDNPSPASSLRSSGSDSPMTVPGSPSTRSTNQPPRPSMVNAPATVSGSPLAR